MRTMTPGAARRQETAETVRGRLTHLFLTPAQAPPPTGPVSPEPAEVVVPPPEPAPLVRGLLFDRRAVLGLSVLLLLAVGYAVQHFWLGRPDRIAVPATLAAASASPPAGPRSGAGPPAGASSGAAVVVDVAGKVRSPGLRTLPSGARVADALVLAGGPLPDTTTDGLNLARVLTDGEQILVGGGAVAAAAPGARAGPVNLNLATREQLDSLPGVGPTLAQRILQHRQEHGPFRSLDQLRQISGIGDRKYAELKALLTL
ncbi:ComEA family DNA-binding protein [Kitasatospora sp. NBC_00070]|uniref:helix-hairpin-helix domain-containing protein n=1 Tax=Kitasatospora sp. NBC_00070 TaxID=2975962 RepID=UPI003243A0B0